MSEQKKVKQKKSERKPFFVLRCSTCGWEQVIKKRSRETYEVLEEMKQAKAINCGRRVCPATLETKVPSGHIRSEFWFGSWSLVRPATLEEYRSIKHARAILEAGLRQLNENDHQF